MCEPERDEGTRMGFRSTFDTGPFWCPKCGRTTCEGGCLPTMLPACEPGDERDDETEREMTLRDKSIRPEPTSESKVYVMGKAASKWDLEAFLTAYLGDDVFARRFADCLEILKRKNADYSQNEHRGDRIAAFRRIARDMDMPMRKVWGVFAQKHWGAIMRFCKEGRVESEPIDGRINDLINYAVLFGPIAEEEQASMPEAEK